MLYLGGTIFRVVKVRKGEVNFFSCAEVLLPEASDVAVRKLLTLYKICLYILKEPR